MSFLCFSSFILIVQIVIGWQCLYCEKTLFAEKQNHSCTKNNAFVKNVTSDFKENISEMKIDPFSKITVKSQRAVFCKNNVADDSLSFCLRYEGGVLVTFADDTTITSGCLEIFICANERKGKSEVSAEAIHKIVFTKNVVMNRKNRKIRADRVELFVEKKICELYGAVTVEQFKQNEQDVPLVTRCEHAQIRFDEEEIILKGTELRPVSTTIEFGGRLRVLGKELMKNKK